MQDLLDGEFDSPPSPPICYLYRRIKSFEVDTLSLIKFAHASDLHLGAPFKRISKTEETDIKERLKNATFLAYDNLVSRCIENKVDALVLAGDIFDSNDRIYAVQRKLQQGIEKLDSFGIKVFACRGNHDPLDGWDPKLPMPDNYKLFSSHYESFPVFEDQPEKVVVHGISYPTRVVTDNLVREFPKPPKDSFNIGVLHANVGNISEHDPYSPCSISDLTNSGYDYWALGHIHKRDILKTSNPTIVYSGNTQSMHRNETGAKGFYIVDVNENKEIKPPKFEPIDVVRFVDLIVNINELQSENDLEMKTNELIEAQLKESSSRDLVLNVIISGSGVLHDLIAKEKFLKEDILQVIKENWEDHRSPFVLIGNLEIKTSPQINRQKWKENDDFWAYFFREIDQWKNNPEKQNEFIKNIDTELSQKSAKFPFRKFLKDSFFKNLKFDELIEESEAINISKLRGSD